VDRRESDKTKALILVIKFFLSNENARLNKVKRLLVERSKWFLNRIMSMTPQVREFSALSSLNDIPVLPVILNPVSCKSIHHGSGKVHLDKLSHPMRKVLKSSYNDSQLEAVSIAIRSTSLKAKFDLSLIQGPPGTGKTRTIVAIVSALLSLHAANSSQRNESFASAEFNKPRPRLSQSVAVTRAWQDAALAKQLINDSQREVPTDRLSKGRVLVCAQSNAAVDELVSRLSEGLYDTDGKLYKPYIVRVGNAKTVHSNSVPFFIDTLVEQRLADELKKNNDSKSLSDTESSSSLRANLEKIVDRIRYYELRRKLLEADKTENDSLVPSDYETDEVSDDAIGAKLNFLYAQKRKVSAELATAHAREKKIADENRFLKHKVRKSILGEAEIVVTTLSGCGGDIYSVCSETASANKFVNFSEHALFDVVVIDEAAQVLSQY
jgi:superfamily I DNA and/or RNA helicase